MICTFSFGDVVVTERLNGLGVTSAEPVWRSVVRFSSLSLRSILNQAFGSSPRTFPVTVNVTRVGEGTTTCWRTVDAMRPNASELGNQTPSDGRVPTGLFTEHPRSRVNPSPIQPPPAGANSPLTRPAVSAAFFVRDVSLDPAPAHDTRLEIRATEATYAKPLAVRLIIWPSLSLRSVSP